MKNNINNNIDNNICNNKKCCIWGCQNPVYDKFLEETDGTGMCGWLWYCKEHFLERAKFLNKRTITRMGNIHMGNIHMKKENEMSFLNKKPVNESVDKPVNQPIAEYHKGSFNDKPVVGQPIDNKLIDIEALEKDLKKDEQLWDEQERLYEKMLNSSIKDIYKKLYTLVDTAKAAADITPTNKKNRQMFDQEIGALTQIEELAQDIREHLKKRDAYKID